MAGSSSLAAARSSRVPSMADLNEGSVGRSGIGKPRTNFLAQPRLLKASILNNPFNKVADSDNNQKDSFNPFASVSSLTNSDKNDNGNNSDVKNSSEEKKSEDIIVPKFVPLQSSGDSISFAGGNSIAATPSGLSRAGGFVFGQNLKQRISSNATDDENAQGPSSSSNDDHPSTNGTSNSLFSVQASSDSFIAPKPTVDGNAFYSGTTVLQQSPHIWERVRDTSLPPIPPEQPVLTGEEGETNQLQMNCRLFAFEGGLWKERGRGQLRLNDALTSSRLVCRSAGSLRILLNTKIWGEMTVDRPGTKSLKITATDAQQQIKVFLIMASPDEISQLYKALARRVAQAQRNDEVSETNKSSSSGNASLLSESDNSTESPQKDTSDNNKNLHNNSSGDDDNNHQAASQSDSNPVPESPGNPVVIISNEDDDNSANREILKRSRSEDSNCIPKKMCMAFPSNDDGTPL